MSNLAKVDSPDTAVTICNDHETTNVSYVILLSPILTSIYRIAHSQHTYAIYITIR